MITEFAVGLTTKELSIDDLSPGLLKYFSAQKAKRLGAKKLYISTCSSEESQFFYESIGCVDAGEVNEEIAAHEPYERQMEYVL